jgi:hypothetical protein
MSLPNGLRRSPKIADECDKGFDALRVDSVPVIEVSGQSNPGGRMDVWPTLERDFCHHPRR